MQRQGKGTRVRAGSTPVPRPPSLGRCLGPSLGLAFGIAACLLAGGCSSPVTEMPASAFPAVEDKPPQRADTPMNQVEIQKTTQDLIIERDRLNAQAPTSAPQGAQANGAAAVTAKKAANAAPAAKKTVRKRAPQQTAATQPATTASAQGAGLQAAGVQAAGTDLKP